MTLFLMAELNLSLLPPPLSWKIGGVSHRLSSVAFPHSNCRAEKGVETAKRTITSNVGPHSNLDTDALQRAMLQYCNSLDPQTGLSSATYLFGRPIKDFIPILSDRYEPHPTWIDTLNKREDALRNRYIWAAEWWTKHTKKSPPLCVGDHVHAQNQTGPHPLKWDKTGQIVEIRQFDQYVVCVDVLDIFPSITGNSFENSSRSKSPRKNVVVEDFKFLPSINRPAPSAPAMLPSESVVETPSTERAIHHSRLLRHHRPLSLHQTQPMVLHLYFQLDMRIFHPHPQLIVNWNHHPQMAKPPLAPPSPKENYGPQRAKPLLAQPLAPLSPKGKNHHWHYIN